MLSLKEFDYELPRALIAQEPAKPRDHARLLCLRRQDGAISHTRFDHLGEYLKAGDLLVINDSRVFPARLIGKKKTSGGRVEIFLHQVVADNNWECLVGGRAHIDLVVIFDKGLEARLLQDKGDGIWLVSFNQGGDKFWRTLEKIGQMPLPPYISPGASQKIDRARYQTVYANSKQNGSVAAPTAGLHFTKRLLAKLKAQGVEVVSVTLHVGLGTFASVKTEDIRQHQIHSEFVSISKKSAQALVKAKQSGHRLVAVGTTSCRVLESYGQEIKQGSLAWGEAYHGWTKIYIYPGYDFQLVDALITNFHLPKSSLLMLIAAFAGLNPVKVAYREAIAAQYRFYSYGDAMFIG